MSRLFSHSAMARIGSTLFEAVGAPKVEAAFVAGELVTSSLMGVDSHGILRIPEYVELVSKGVVVPGAQITVRETSSTTAVVDGGLNFGAITAHRVVATAVEIASKHKTACISTQRCNHVGRLGAWVQAAAERDLIALATANSPVHGHFVVPWGGKQGRLATNPMAYGVPTGGDPIVADISTSVVPEGKIRWHKNQGKPLGEGWVIDAEGQPTTDPNRFYGPPMGGILPLGGSAGHKGFALSLLVEILGSALAGNRTTDATVVGNGFCVIVIDPSAFCPIPQFKKLMDELVTYIKSSPPAAGVEEVLVPGELEFRTMRQRLQQGIPVDDVTWQLVEEHARRLGVALKAPTA